MKNEGEQLVLAQQADQFVDKVEEILLCLGVRLGLVHEAVAANLARG